jgi:hypothetical protein
MRKSYRKIIPMRLKFAAAFVDEKDERKLSYFFRLTSLARWPLAKAFGVASCEGG